MSTLDRYIARQFITNVVTLLVILFSFVVVVDVSINIGQFVGVAEKLGARDGEGPGAFREALVSVLVIADLWWPRLLQLYNFVIGVVMVAAMGFTLTQLTRNREVLAMLAAGMSLGRISRPIVVAAIGFLLLQAVNQELVVPRVAHLLVRDHHEAGNRSMGSMPVPLTPDGQGRLWRADSFDADRGVMEMIFVIERDSTGRGQRVVTADRAVWNDGGWDLEFGYAEARGTAKAIEPWMAAVGPLTRIETSLDPTQLRMNQFKAYRRALSFRQVGQMLARDDLLDGRSRDRLERIRWGRVSMMISSGLSLLIALPFYIAREPRNMAVQSLKCAPITIGALMLGALGSSAGIPGLPPAVGVFVPVMLLGPMAIAMLSSIRS